MYKIVSVHRSFAIPRPDESRVTGTYFAVRTGLHSAALALNLTNANLTTELVYRALYRLVDHALPKYLRDTSWGILLVNTLECVQKKGFVLGVVTATTMVGIGVEFDDLRTLFAHEVCKSRASNWAKKQAIHAITASLDELAAVTFSTLTTGSNTSPTDHDDTKSSSGTWLETASTVGMMSLGLVVAPATLSVQFMMMVLMILYFASEAAAKMVLRRDESSAILAPSSAHYGVVATVDGTDERVVVKFRIDGQPFTCITPIKFFEKFEGDPGFLMPPTTDPVEYCESGKSCEMISQSRVSRLMPHTVASLLENYNQDHGVLDMFSFYFSGWRYVLVSCERLLSEDLVHLDIRAANIFVDSNGTFIVGDFDLILDRSTSLSVKPHPLDRLFFSDEIVSGSNAERFIVCRLLTLLNSILDFIEHSNPQADRTDLLPILVLRGLLANIAANSPTMKGLLFMLGRVERQLKQYGWSGHPSPEKYIETFNQITSSPHSPKPQVRSDL